MSKACVLIAFGFLAGCGSAPPRADVPMSAVVGEYHGYMEPNVVEMDPVEQGIMKAVRFSMLTIKEDGSYTVVVDHPDRKKDNGKLLDQGTVVIQGKSLTFKSKTPFDPNKINDQSFTVMPGIKLDPEGRNKFAYRFPSGHRMVLFKSG